MTMKLPTLMIAFGLLGLPGSTSADGMPSRVASHCCVSPTWSGVYAGFYAGGAWANADWAFPFAETFNTIPGQHFSTSPQGAIVGMQAGINYQLGYFLVGAEASFGGSNMQDTLTGPVTAALPADRLRRSLVLGIDYSYVDLSGTRFSTNTNAGGPFNLDLGDVRFETVTARLSILLDASPTAPTK